MIPTDFAPTYPCFGLFDDDCRGPYLVSTGSGSSALLILTDDDLLERFRKQTGSVGPAIRFDNAAQLVLFLDSLPNTVTYIAFDPSVSAKAITVAATELYKKLLDSLKRQ